MTKEQRYRASALLLLTYVLEYDWGLSPDHALIQEINAEVWALCNDHPYVPEPGSITAASAKDIISMLTPPTLSDDKRLERGAFLLFTSLELSRDNSLVDRG